MACLRTTLLVRIVKWRGGQGSVVYLVVIENDDVTAVSHGAVVNSCPLAVACISKLRMAAMSMHF